MSKVYSIAKSDKTGERKTPVDSAEIVNDYGIVDDAHAGYKHRQISLLAIESIKKMQDQGLDVKNGDFAENITTEGIDLCALDVGDVLEIGDIKLTISQLGKICHNRCAIYHLAGDCVMPREGIFAVVEGDGIIKSGDEIVVKKKTKPAVTIITLDETADAIVLLERVKACHEPSVIRYEHIDDVKDLNILIEDLVKIQKMDAVVLSGWEKPEIKAFENLVVNQIEEKACYVIYENTKIVFIHSTKGPEEILAMNVCEG